MMIKLLPFKINDYEVLSSWIKNEEDLIQFAGDIFSYPLNLNQIENYLKDNKRHAFNIIYSDKIIGHSEIYLEDNKKAKLGKILIGDVKFRNKGLGKSIVKKLLQKCFDEFDIEYVHLYVYDWNISAIKCYEKCQMIKNGKTKITKFNNKIWKAIDMEIYLKKMN